MSQPNWSDKKHLLQQLQRLWDRGLLLREAIQPEALFPLRLSFKTPASKDLSTQVEAVRRWLAEIEKLEGFRIEYKTVHHRLIGDNRLPARVWLDDLENAISLLNKQQDLAAFLQIEALTRKRAPQLLDWLMQYPLKALPLAQDWPKLLDFVLWRKQYPHRQIYLRQVSISGLDSKFIERHRAILMPLLDRVLPPESVNSAFSSVKQFEKRYGFRSKPERIRFRLPPLDSPLLPGKDGDITLTAEDFAVLNQSLQIAGQIKRIFITENEINFLSFPLPADSLLIFGSGYGFDALARADWLKGLELYYWGDIDTHGFAILDQLRSKFPEVKSLLMDEQTLLRHRDFWGLENSPENKPLPRLTADEQALYQNLLKHHYAENLRLEQERVNYAWLTAAIEA